MHLSLCAQHGLRWATSFPNSAGRELVTRNLWPPDVISLAGNTKAISSQGDEEKYDDSSSGMIPLRGYLASVSYNERYANCLRYS